MFRNVYKVLFAFTNIFRDGALPTSMLMKQNQYVNALLRYSQMQLKAHRLNSDANLKCLHKNLAMHTSRTILFV